MQIQSLSIAVPAGCCNECGFCVSRMHEPEYVNQIEGNTRFFDLYERDYVNRLAFARDNGCNSAILTGDGEPLLNRSFLKFFTNCNRSLAMPFRQVELQTCGGPLDEECLRFLRNTVGVSVISFSISSLDNNVNRLHTKPKDKKWEVDIYALCRSIVKYDFTLRLSINLTDYFSDCDVPYIFTAAREHGARQIIFRVLYESGGNHPQDIWVRERRCGDKKVAEIRSYIKENGRPLRRLPFGAVAYSVGGLSVVLDEDCMQGEVTENLKYLILRPDCKLYSHWNDKGV